VDDTYKKINITVWPQHKLNYWGITKCANSAVKSSLLGHTVKNIHKRDKSLHSSQNVTYISQDAALSNTYTNFTVTRDPYERFISLYKDFGCDRYKSIGLENTVTFDYFLEYVLEKFPNDDCNIHFKSQCSFITKNNQFMFDNVFKMPQLIKFFKRQGIQMHEANVSKEQEVILTNNHKEQIYNRYKNDFILLGY
jgi:hypothetical protein